MAIVLAAAVVLAHDQTSPETRQEARPASVLDDPASNGDFTAKAINELWLTDVTEHHTSEGKLYMCAVKDVFSNKIIAAV